MRWSILVRALLTSRYLPADPLEWYIDNVDCALIHVGALIHSEVHNERLFGFAEPYDWNQVLGIFRKLYPDREFPADRTNGKIDKMTVPNQRAEEVLTWIKASGWTPLDESLRVMSEQFS